MLKVKEFVAEEDYECICNWWEARHWPIIPLDYLPKTGLVIEDDWKGKCCAGFLYSTDSAFCWLEFIIASPWQSYEERSLALALLIEKLSERAQEKGFKAVFTTTNNDSLLKKLVNKNFTVTDENVTHLARRF